MLNKQCSASGQSRRTNRPPVAVILMTLLSGANTSKCNPQKCPWALHETSQTLGNALRGRGEKRQRLPFRRGQTVPIKHRDTMRCSAFPFIFHRISSPPIAIYEVRLVAYPSVYHKKLLIRLKIF